MPRCVLQPVGEELPDGLALADDRQALLLVAQRRGPLLLYFLPRLAVERLALPVRKGEPRAPTAIAVLADGPLAVGALLSWHRWLLSLPPGACCPLAGRPARAAGEQLPRRQ